VQLVFINTKLLFTFVQWTHQVQQTVTSYYHWQNNRDYQRLSDYDLFLSDWLQSDV